MTRRRFRSAWASVAGGTIITVCASCLTGEALAARYSDAKGLGSPGDCSRSSTSSSKLSRAVDSTNVAISLLLFDVRICACSGLGPRLVGLWKTCGVARIALFRGYHVSGTSVRTRTAVRSRRVGDKDVDAASPPMLCARFRRASAWRGERRKGDESLRGILLGSEGRARVGGIARWCTHTPLLAAPRVGVDLVYYHVTCTTRGMPGVSDRRRGVCRGMQADEEGGWPPRAWYSYVAAPMVDQSDLAFRATAVQYGATATWTYVCAHSHQPNVSCRRYCPAGRHLRASTTGSGTR